MKRIRVPLPEVPRSWLILLLIVSLVYMRSFGIDSWTTAALGTLIGYILGKDIENVRIEKRKIPL